MRIALCAALVLALPRPADACVRAGETNQLVGWSADGKYALYVLADDKGKLDHAEILPTTYAGFVYTITADDDATGMIVSRTKVGSCASFGEEGVVEKKKGKLTDKSLMELKTVAAMKFGKLETEGKAVKPSAASFTGPKRYDVHDIQLTVNDAKLVMPLPVYCVGSCLADENWQKWSITVEGVHTQGGLTLYDLTMPNVCNGGTLHRLVAQTPADVKVPKHRCTGSGE